MMSCQSITTACLKMKSLNESSPYIYIHQSVQNWHLVSEVGCNKSMILGSQPCIFSLGTCSVNIMIQLSIISLFFLFLFLFFFEMQS